MIQVSNASCRINDRADVVAGNAQIPVCSRQEVGHFLGVTEPLRLDLQLFVLAEPEVGPIDLADLVGHQIHLACQRPHISAEFRPDRFHFAERLPGVPVVVQDKAGSQLEIDQSTERPGAGERERIVLTHDLHHPVEPLGQCSGRNHPSVKVGSTSPRVYRAGENHLLPVQEEPTLDPGLLTVRPDESGTGGGSGEHPEGAQHEGLARSGLAAHHHHPGHEPHPGRIDDPEVADRQFV